MEFITRERMDEIDRNAISRGISVERLMENAGKSVAEYVMKLDRKPDNVIVLSGKGNNGGDGLVCARYLAETGKYNVIIVGCEKDRDRYNNHVNYQLDKLEKHGVKFLYNPDEEKLKENDVIIDALLGYKVTRDPEARIGELIDIANKMKKEKWIRIISVDIPSGLDANSGHKYDPCIEADHVVTFVQPYNGLKEMYEDCKVEVADIGIK